MAAFHAFGVAPPVIVILMAYLIGQLGGALPIPGGIGGIDGGLIGTLIVYGIRAAGAAAAVLLYRVVLFWVPIVMGLPAFLSLRRGIEDIRRPDLCLPPHPAAHDDMTTTAFVLAGGASLGAIHVGMLQALYERGIRPDVIVGTSAGALNGAFIASRPQTVATASDLGEVWSELTRRQAFPVHPLTGVMGFLGARDHLVPASGLRRVIERHVDVSRLEDTEIPLHVIAVDVLTGLELRLSHGPLAEAVLASASIPGVLPPVSWDGRPLVDGGVANNTPISHAVELGADRIYVLPTGHACALQEAPRGALAMGVQAISLLMHRRLAHDVERHRAGPRLIVLPPPCPQLVSPIEFDHAEELTAMALDDARSFLDGGGEDRPPLPMRVHSH